MDFWNNIKDGIIWFWNDVKKTMTTPPLSK